MRKERAGHALQATVLVSEAFLGLSRAEKLHFKDRNQFFGMACIVMRRVLREYAQQRNTIKRGREFERVPRDTSILRLTDDKRIDLLELDEALCELEARDSQMARVVELRFFSGLTNSEVATVLRDSERTVKRKGAAAKPILYDLLTPGG